MTFDFQDRPGARHTWNRAGMAADAYAGIGGYSQNNTAIYRAADHVGIVSGHLALDNPTNRRMVGADLDGDGYDDDTGEWMGDYGQSDASGTYTPETSMSWLDKINQPQDVIDADTIFRSLAGDINGWVAAASATDPNYTAMSLLSSNYAGWLGGWEQEADGGFFSSTADVDVGTYTTQYQSYKHQYEQLTGQKASNQQLPQLSFAAKLGKGVQDLVNPGAGKNSNVLVYALLIGGAIGGYLLLMGSAKLSAAAQGGLSSSPRKP